MKVSETQKKVIKALSKPYQHGKHHPKDAFNERTIFSLVDKELVEIYNHSTYLHGAVRLTEKGKQLLNSI